MVQEDVFYFAKMTEKWEEINIFEAANDGIKNACTFHIIVKTNSFHWNTFPTVPSSSEICQSRI